MRATSLLKTAAHDEGVWATAWLSGSSSLLTGSVDETVKQWSVADDKLECVHTFSGHALGVISLDVDPSGSYAASSSLDSMIRVFGIEDRAMKHLLERPPTESWRTVFGAVTPQSTQLAVAGGSTGRVFTYRGSSEEPALEATLDLPQVCWCVCRWFGASNCQTLIHRGGPDTHRLLQILVGPLTHRRLVVALTSACSPRAPAFSLLAHPHAHVMLATRPTPVVRQ